MTRPRCLVLRSQTTNVREGRGFRGRGLGNRGHGGRGLGGPGGRGGQGYGGFDKKRSCVIVVMGLVIMLMNATIGTFRRH